MGRLISNFVNLRFKVVKRKHYMGICMGDANGERVWSRGEVSTWEEDTLRLSKVAAIHAQTSYAGFQ